MPWFQIPEKDTDLCFHLQASNPKLVQNCERLKLKTFLAITSSVFKQMPRFRIPEKDTELCFHFQASNPKLIQNCERYERLKLKNAFGHNFISFQENASIPDSRERYRPLIKFASFKFKIDSKSWEIWEIAVCERCWYWWNEARHSSCMDHCNDQD